MENQKILIVFYSRSGITKKIAQQIKEILKCDIEEIQDNSNRSGFLGFMKSGFQAMKDKTTNIIPPKSDPASYDLIILATPVWASKMSSPMRSYIENLKSSFKKVAYIATQAGESKFTVFHDFEATCEKSPVNTLGITEKDIKTGNSSEKIKSFIENLL